MTNIFEQTDAWKNRLIDVVSYVRESTQNQTMFGYRPDVQKENIERYCKRHNFKSVALFEDSGSGKDTEKRPKFLEMIRYVKLNHNVKFIVIDETSRFFRNVEESLRFERELLEECGLYAIDTRIDYHPREYLTDGITTSQWSARMQARVRAEEERKIIQERVKEGYTKKANLGLYCGEVAFGLEWKDVHKKYIGYKENESKIVKEIFKLYQTGNYGYTTLARHLNDLGYRRPEVEREHVIVAESHVHNSKVVMKLFTDEAIKGALKNTSFIGTQNTKPNLRLMTINEFQSLCLLPPLISVDDFNYVQMLISQNRRGAGKNGKTSRQKSVFLLQGIAYSAVNGSKLHGQTEINEKLGKKTRRYIPSTNKSGTDEHIPSIEADVIESKIVRLLQQIKIKNIDVIENELRGIIKIDASSFKADKPSSSSNTEHKLKRALKALEELQQYSYSYQNEHSIKNIRKQLQATEMVSVAKTPEEMKYYDLIELKNVLMDVSKEFLRLQDLSVKEGLLKILFSEFFVGQLPSEEALSEDFASKISDTKDLKALLQKFVPNLFHTIYVKQEKDVIDISFEPTGLFLTLVDKVTPTYNNVGHGDGSDFFLKKKE